MTPSFPKCRLRIVLAPGVAFGPGKADLLQGLAETGSIRAAGSRLGMSYKRAWNLVGALNRDFAEPLVTTEKGGAGGGGGARLTPLGHELLERFRRIEAVMLEAGGADLSVLQGAVKSPLDGAGEEK
ncbi:LysR family transcriptional regulator [Breoghania sp. L-A4]|uniref:winged helix-turn-helix domain-containing protein n=1 Tax=Breoghania sp. L-A4 TaxID=2304600 RepID=UPI000E3595DD|nr:LysR family transcriptional regulator [Breoghania sp. L-A4]AXS41958.1 LysR family transcriptional regulator [Breoghania sp. L-A4]